MDINQENEIEFDFKSIFDDNFSPSTEFKKYVDLQFELLSVSNYSIDKEKFFQYMFCCKVMRDLVEKQNGTVREDYLSQMNGNSYSFNRGIRIGCFRANMCYLNFYGDDLKKFLKIADLVDNIEITPKPNGTFDIDLSIQNVYINEGISL